MKAGEKAIIKKAKEDEFKLEVNEDEGLITVRYDNGDYEIKDMVYDKDAKEIRIDGYMNADGYNMLSEYDVLGDTYYVTDRPSGHDE